MASFLSNYHFWSDFWYLSNCFWLFLAWYLQQVSSQQPCRRCYCWLCHAPHCLPFLGLLLLVFDCYTIVLRCTRFDIFRLNIIYYFFYTGLAVSVILAFVNKGIAPLYGNDVWYLAVPVIGIAFSKINIEACHLTDWQKCRNYNLPKSVANSLIFLIETLFKYYDNGSGNSGQKTQENMNLGIQTNTNTTWVFSVFGSFEDAECWVGQVLQLLSEK